MSAEQVKLHIMALVPPIWYLYNQNRKTDTISPCVITTPVLHTMFKLIIEHEFEGLATPKALFYSSAGTATTDMELLLCHFATTVFYKEEKEEEEKGEKATFSPTASTLSAAPDGARFHGSPAVGPDYYGAIAGPQLPVELCART